MHRMAVRFEHGFRDIRVRQLGPFLALTWNDDKAPPRSLIDVAPPEVVAIHVRRWVVPADMVLPTAIMEGNPGPADFEALGAPAYSRLIGQLEHGKGESSDLTLKHYVAGFDVDLTDELSLDPMGGIAVSGMRTTVNVGEVAVSGVDVGVLTSFGTPAVIRQSDAVIKGHGVLQTATLKTSAVALHGRMQVGDTLSAVTQDIEDENRLVVIAVTRVGP
jgi:hypothetical protein